MMEKVSLVVPCYNEEEVLPYFYEEFCRVAKQLSDYIVEVIFIDDGSKDQTLSVVKKFSEKDARVKYLSFSRNFGKEAAIYAGFQYADGEYVAMLDADLQDPPSLLPKMLQAIKEEGYDSVATRRVSRKGEPPVRSFFARCFYKLMNKISTAEIMDGARDYRLMTRQFKDAILEYNRFSKGIFGWVGFKTKWIEFENVERKAGETKWSFWKLFKYSLEGIIGFSTAPLAMVSMLGVGVCMIAFLFLLFILVKTICFGDPVAGWPSMACMILMLGGIQLLCMGILGMYLSKTYLETKKRPIYICGETNLNVKMKEEGKVL